MSAKSHEKQGSALQDCTCGHFKTLDVDGRFLHGESSRQEGLETSFVHLALPSTDASSLWPERSSHEAHEGFLETVRHASTLLHAAQGKALSEKIFLCQQCVDRVIRAIESDKERLQDETMAYRQAVVDEKERQEKLNKALLYSRWDSESSYGNDDSPNMLEGTESSFRDEIAALTVACEQHENELTHLQSLHQEQLMISHELDVATDSLEDRRNTLQLDARAFSHVHSQCASKLREIQYEVECLSSVKIHSSLFNLVVDKRGLRYPLINELRLAYRPKGDVHWSEINAAWSQAAQLLLLIAASIKFRSKDWRIVPLTLGSKLIYLDGKHRSVYNLGGTSDMAMSLRATNALMEQMCRHMSGLLSQQHLNPSAPPLPYEMTCNTIGSCDLSKLAPSDDSGWSRVIHFVASNLQWLSARASEHERQTVTLVA